MPPTLLFRDTRTGLVAYDNDGALVTSARDEVMKLSEWEREQYTPGPPHFIHGPEDGEVVSLVDRASDRLNVVIGQRVHRYARAESGDFRYVGETTPR